MKALVVIDIQCDFMPGGALAVPLGDEIIPIVNVLLPKYQHIIATQDWHPKHHKSFASNHLGKKPFDVIIINGIEQVLWPNHCIAGSCGAEFHPDLKTQYFKVIIRKGTNPEVDSYSSFFDNDYVQSTGLEGCLKELKITELHFVGLAADYCVYHSMKDALKLGFKVKLYENATRAISEENYQKQKKELLQNDDFGILHYTLD
ncbi:bifunctional nicotinamidase/pyrazinamidase [Moraxella haemolytica]|uniref:bifunctional nicotinamidase/pyrazinamidase n=1 Tax=Moraxella TaxID=475 RepID=UPI002543D854|nr:bifunctional nicotinamidase/pyrazinamidase [Moraxella sp. ZY171148]WII95098.1 bifunctional nicotinamidase/pyrazinamidase [Moraxella sp. ZY171148]